jgi:alpha-beta hydrolase superfamily lysophospholipase
MGSVLMECHDGFTMQTLPVTLNKSRPHRPSWLVRGLARTMAAAMAALLSSAGIETQQRKLIFQLGTRTGETGVTDCQDMAERWIEFDSEVTGKPVRLHSLWLERPEADAPVLLYLHGARWDVSGSAQRMQQLNALGFSVLGIDYRGFGRSSDELPSEGSACEDARAAWSWLAARHAQAKRYVYGHSLGGAIAVQLATQIGDASGVIVEGTFTSIPEVFGTLKWGWLPLRALITQRFDSFHRVTQITAPLIVVHGSNDELISPTMGRALFDRATVPKRFILVEGGSHHDTHNVGHFQYREALRDFFGLSA